MFQSLTGLAKKIGFIGADQKSASLTDPLAEQLFGVLPTASGAAVTANSALNVPAVLQAVRLIAETCGSLPVKVYTDQADGKQAAKDHPAYKIAHSRANEWTSANQFRTQLTLDALMHGNAIARVIRIGNGQPYELHRLDPTKVQILTDTLTGQPVFRVNTAQGQADYPFTDILHLQAFGGTSPVKLAREAIGIAMVLEKHAAQLFGSGARPDSLIYNEKPIPGTEQGEKTLSNVRRAWNIFSGGGKSGPLILDNGWKYQPISFSSTDSQFLEHRLEQINEIARIFGVPPTMLFQLERATWSNAEEMGRSFLQLCLRPWLDKWQDAYNNVLFNEAERDTHYCEFVIDDLQRADSAGRADIFSTLITSRVMTSNEARAAMNLPPLPGGDELQNPNTTSSAAPITASPATE